MSRLTIIPSPTPDVILTPYSESEFPRFSEIFKPADGNTHPAIKRLLHPADDAELTLVLHNRSQKAITAMQEHWLIKNKSGYVGPWTNSLDSYHSDFSHPVVDPGDRHLLSVGINVSERFLTYVRSGGAVGEGFDRPQEENWVSELTFQVYLVVFEDGEIAGPDPEHFCDELIRHREAAEFIARQIRLAESEGRDARPVLSALMKAPLLESDYAAHWVQWYARSYLIGAESQEAQLHRLENFPALPKFYRRTAN